MNSTLLVKAELKPQLILSKSSKVGELVKTWQSASGRQQQKHISDNSKGIADITSEKIHKQSDIQCRLKNKGKWWVTICRQTEVVMICQMKTMFPCKKMRSKCERNKIEPWLEKGGHDLQEMKWKISFTVTRSGQNAQKKWNLNTRVGKKGSKCAKKNEIKHRLAKGGHDLQKFQHARQSLQKCTWFYDLNCRCSYICKIAISAIPTMYTTILQYQQDS